MIKHESQSIVVGVDGSEQSKEALRWAARLSVSIVAPIVAITSWRTPGEYSYGYASIPSDWNPKVDAEKLLEQTLDDVFGSERPASLSVIVSNGHPAQVLLDASKEAAMLIVGSRGHGGFTGLLLGSVSANCAEHATCPVLVVR
jgi:nucleotide-binding universal stress UspA family protein